MRHAKAESFSDDDHERVLTDRGVRAAADAGRHLSETGVSPDHVVVSSAVRAQGTWDSVAGELSSGSAPRVSVDESVYNGSPDVVLDALRAVPDGVATVLFVGHNPSAGYVANQLDDGDGDPDAINEMLHGFPAGALVVFEVAVPWSDLADECGRVVDFYVGHG